MTTEAKHSWSRISNEVRLETWQAALVAHNGYIKRAAKALGIARSYATKLTKEYDLNDFAAELRLKAGATRVADGRVTGRPRVKKNPRVTE